MLRKTKDAGNQELTKEEHYSRLKWLKAKGFHLDVRQFAKLKEYQNDPELNQHRPTRAPYAD